MKKILLAIALLGIVSIKAYSKDRKDRVKTYVEKGTDGKDITVKFTYKNWDDDMTASSVQPYMIFCGQGTETPYPSVIAINLKEYYVVINSDPGYGVKGKDTRRNKRETACTDACGVQFNNIASLISRQVKLKGKLTENLREAVKEDIFFTKYLLNENGEVKYKFKTNGRYYGGIPEPICKRSGYSCHCNQEKIGK